jgi:hypothetical protein
MSSRGIYIYSLNELSITNDNLVVLPKKSVCLRRLNIIFSGKKNDKEPFIAIFKTNKNVKVFFYIYEKIYLHIFLNNILERRSWNLFVKLEATNS